MTSLHSVETRINTILNLLGCAITNFAAIANRLSASRVSAALTGVSDFGPADGEYHLQVAQAMKSLADEYPVPIDWKQVSRVRSALDARRATSRPIPFAVLYVNGQLFKRVFQGQPEFTTSYRDCAALSDLMLASRAAKILDGMGLMGIRIVTITNEFRSEETLSKTLQDVGFTQQWGKKRKTGRARIGPAPPG